MKNPWIPFIRNSWNTGLDGLLQLQLQQLSFEEACAREAPSWWRPWPRVLILND